MPTSVSIGSNGFGSSESGMLSLSSSGSQASPCPSMSLSAWLVFGVSTQLSSPSGTVSSSRSVSAMRAVAHGSSGMDPPRSPQLAKPNTSMPRAMSPVKMKPLYSFDDQVSAPFITLKPLVFPHVVNSSSSISSVELGGPS